ncbi:hypothetical protein CIPAW_05G262500 [Carya illinoinensis]|uniref:Uncharacterized protein n=1 Tax=Carya illinoinensis TaxID=32201 RepID=A0A8T1QMN1_CARIL|nr:hypothetical protein CIPAW_05G262500 [Carya illinoinensis]
MNEFNDFIDRCGLFELTCLGQRLSWCNGHDGTSRSWAKRDKVLINNNFLTRFQFAKVNYLCCKSSDHFPMVVSSEISFTAYGPSPFRFMNMWCLHVDFLNIVKEVWNIPDEVQGMMKLVTHLKRTKVALRAWNKTVFGRVEGNIRALEERMDILEDKLQHEFFEELEDDFLATKIELDLWEKREASHLGQLAKKKWLNEGDKNSAFFHAVIKQRRLKGMIKKMVLSDGRVWRVQKQFIRDFLNENSEVESYALGELVDEKVSDEDNEML